MHIVEVLALPVRAGFFVDDQAAIRGGAIHDGFGYHGEPVTPGFNRIRQPGEAVSILLILSDGSVAHGDCASVQYTGVGGRDPVFRAHEAVRVIEGVLAPALRGQQVTDFRRLASEIDGIGDRGLILHSAIRYGVSQAILSAVALAKRVTMAEVIRDEYHTGVELVPVPIYVQSGEDRYLNAEKMILGGADVLPHGLINSVEYALGRDGQLLAEYLEWLVRRIAELAPTADYRPRIHLDTYGTIGLAFVDSSGEPDIPAVASYIAMLGTICSPLSLTIEQPIDAGSLTAQIAVCGALRTELRLSGSSVKIAVDEWCNTLEDIRLFVDAAAADVIHIKMPDLGGLTNSVEALLLVKQAGLEAFCGGSSSETDRSAVISAHVAMACGADQILAKPGMGGDEALMIVGNEMARTAALARATKNHAAPIGSPPVIG